MSSNGVDKLDDVETLQQIILALMEEHGDGGEKMWPNKNLSQVLERHILQSITAYDERIVVTIERRRMRRV